MEYLNSMVDAKERRNDALTEKNIGQKSGHSDVELLQLLST